MRIDVLSRKKVPQILTYLYNRDFASVDNVRKGIGSYSASNLLNYLERRGFVKSEMHHRYKVYRLTDVGTAYAIILTLPDEKLLELIMNISK
jgi:Mn-dependent DtxR family transcriptional regulator